MKLGVMSALFAGMPFDEMLEYCAEVGLDAVELPVGGYPGSPFLDAAKVLASSRLQKEIRAKLDGWDLQLSGLAVHGNPVHPDRAPRRSSDHAGVRNRPSSSPRSSGTRTS